jgi:hypothetical protein
MYLLGHLTSGSRMVLAQVAVSDTVKEITAFPLLLRRFRVRSRIMDTDAWGC